MIFLRNYKLYNNIINYNTIHHQRRIEIIKIYRNSSENRIRNFSLNSHFLNTSSSSSSSNSSTYNPNANIVKLAFNEYGNEKNTTITSSPIVIMHGLFGSKQNWKSICKAIAAKSEPNRKVYAIDARNHGDSPHSMEHSYENLADDIRGFLNEQNIGKSIVIGHSMGGRAMMCLALKYPEIVEKAIIIDISPETHSPSFQKMGLLFDAMNQIKIPNTLNMSAGRKLADEQLMKNVPDKATRDFVLMNLLKNDDDGSFNWTKNLLAILGNNLNIAYFPNHFENQRCSFNGLILFIAATKSPHLRNCNLKNLKKLFPKAKLILIESGHNIPNENAAELIKEILLFINCS